MASTSLTRTSSASATKGTLSMWVKRSKLGTTQYLHHNVTSTSSNYGLIVFDTNDQIEMMISTSGSHTIKRITNRKFRDTSAWYHFVFVTDVTNSTAQNRMRIYVNGVEETSFSTNDSPSGASNRFYEASASNDHVIGANASNSNNFDGSMSHVYNIVDTVYTPSAFGETDSTTGEWKIKTSPSVTFGSQGYLILKDGNTITDQSSNSNNFTLAAGTLTNTEDCPSNVFCTMNPLDNYWMNGTFAYGNTRVTTDTTKFGYNTGTLGASSGKWYWEMKLAQAVTSGDYHVVGVASVHPFNQEGLGYEAGGYAYQGEQGNKRINGSQTSYGSAWSTNDIIGIAMDLDNKKLYFSKNNVWQNSGVPTSGSTGTGAISLTQDGFYYPAVSDHAGGLYSAGIFDFNFGNGYFATTAVASAGTNASGIGIFEYDVPTGYTALSTKGLNL